MRLALPEDARPLDPATLFVFTPAEVRRILAASARRLGPNDQFGAGQFQLYNGARLAANGNVVVVNVTYRIGVFGGLELSSLGEGFDDNLALRDQIAALEWVRDNIAAFGGDPRRVTVFGESAGATSVLALLASPGANGLFGRAIAQSPALPLM